MSVKLIPSESRRTFLKEWLLTDPVDRDQPFIPQILDELNDLSFFRSHLHEISRDNADIICLNMTLLNFKKKRIEPCTNSFQIILEGKISACLENNEEDTEQMKQQLKDKFGGLEKKNIHQFQRGDCFNIVSVWSQKQLSFHFECEETTHIIDVPLEKGGNALLESFRRKTNENYAFLLATLSKHDNHLTQQKARDLLLITTIKKYTKGETLMKKDGMVVFIKSGEFSVFKEISKHKEQIEVQSPQRFPLAYNEIEQESVGDLRVKKATSLKRVHLGIKRHDSLIELSTSDEAIDGIECFTNEGEILICSQEAYQKIQENQEKRIFASKDPSSMKHKELKSNRLSQQLSPRTQIEEQRSISVQRRKVSRKLCPFFEEWNKNEARRPKHDMLFQYSPNEEINSEKNIGNRPSQREQVTTGLEITDEFKRQQISKNSSISKQEATYRQSLLDTIGQQMSTYGDYLYASNNKNNLLRNSTNTLKFPNQYKHLNEKDMKLPSSTPQKQETQKLQELMESNFATNPGRNQLSKKLNGFCKNPIFNQDHHFIRGSSVDPRDQGKQTRINNFTNTLNQDIIPNGQIRSKAVSQSSSSQSNMYFENPSEISHSQDKHANTSRPTTTTTALHGLFDMQSPLKAQRKLSDGSLLQTLSIDIGKVKKSFDSENYNIICGSKTSRQFKKDESLNEYKVVMNPNAETTYSVKQNSTSNNTPKSGTKSDINSPLSCCSKQSPLCYENFSQFYNSNNRNKSIGRSIHFIKQEDSQNQLPGDNSPGSCSSPVNFTSFSQKPSSFSKQLLRESLMKRTQQRMSSQIILNEQNTSEMNQEAEFKNNSDKNLKESENIMPQQQQQAAGTINLDIFQLPQKRNSNNLLLPIGTIVYPIGNISRLKGSMSVQNSPIRVFSEIRSRK